MNFVYCFRNFRHMIQYIKSKNDIKCFFWKWKIFTSNTLYSVFIGNIVSNRIFTSSIMPCEISDIIRRLIIGILSLFLNQNSPDPQPTSRTGKFFLNWRWSNIHRKNPFLVAIYLLWNLFWFANYLYSCIDYSTNTFGQQCFSLIEPFISFSFVLMRIIKGLNLLLNM